ncbi:hypothetical protein LPJ66_000480 [Kickxella alabastrina]|uniref:Uncharacterized protein n=1 Tax=Kickxella alabastrina TaxID=61397 RepID=A0ACC1IVS9_9FUNG|nr:hypothetical protein LPJ66_000480 [Kickxella alabastrina]
MGERMHNNSQLAAGPQQKQQQQAQALSPAHARPTYHMPPPTNTHRPLADDQPRTNSVENLLQGRNQAQPKSDINGSSNGSGSSSSSSAGRPLRDRLHASSSPHHSGEALGPPQKLNSQRAHDQQPQGGASPYASASARPLSQVSSQLPSTSAVSYAGRQQLYNADTTEAGPMQARVPPPTGSFGPSQYVAGQAPFRRARPHAATIGDPMASSQAAMHSRPPQQQQGFRFYPQQQPASGYDSRHMQQQAPHSDSRPRRLSFLGAQVVGEGHREQYETSFARSTSNTGPHFGPGGQQPSPQSQFYASRQPMHQQQHQYQQMHSMLPPPPASAPSHQQHFGHAANQGQRPHGGPAGTYGPCNSYGPSGALQPRSLSPQAHPRHQFPVLDRFDAADGPQQRQQPMAFPRIPSPMEKPVVMQVTPTSGSTATSGTAAAANATSQSPARETTRRLSSVVWGPTGFERLESGLSRCRICGKEYSRGSSTGTLKRHFRQHQVNVPLAGSYARASSPGPAPGSRPRAYSHRVDMRARRDVSPFAPAIPPRPSQHQQQNPVQLPMIRHAQQMRQPMSPPQHSMMIEHKHMLPMLITPETPSASSAMATLFSRSSGRSVDDMDTNSAIAGSALLSMAAGDSRMAVDSEGGRRIQRLSDPMPFQMPSAPAHVSEAGDISVSPTPSVSSSPSSRRLHFLRDNVVGNGSGGFRQQPFNQPIVLPPLQNIPNFNEADEMDVVSDGDDAQPLLKRPRRATVAGVQSLAFRGDGFPAELRPEIDSLSPSQLVALSSELVRRVAKVLPVLAIEVADTVAAAASKSDAASTDPVDMLVGHIKRTLLDIPNSPRDDEAHHDRLPSPSSLLSFLSSPQSALATVSSCSLPFTIRKQVPLSQLSSQSTSSTMSLLSRVSAAMQRIAPLSLAELEWDNVGILLEAAKPRANANKVFLTIDLTTATLEEALKDPSVGVIVAYHPPIFSAWKSLTMGNLKQSLVLRCASAGVSIYSPHTSLDSCANGINDWLASLVGDGKVTPITPAKAENAAGQENAGHGRLLELATPRSLSDIVADVKTRLALNHVRVARAPRHEQDEELVSRIAICAGSGESVVGPVAADLYFTGEMGHHDVLAAVAKNTSCILAEHTNTERGYLQGTLKARLQQELNADSESDSTDVLVSRLDRDPITIE